MDTGSSKEIVEAGFEAWEQAAWDRDIDAMSKLYAPDAVCFDVIGSLRDVGREAITQRMALWFAQFSGPIKARFRDVQAYHSGNLAVGVALNHITGDLSGGGRLDILSRVTVVMQYTPDGWCTVHEHVSVPFDPLTGQVSTDLQP